MNTSSYFLLINGLFGSFSSSIHSFELHLDSVHGVIDQLRTKPSNHISSFNCIKPKQRQMDGIIFIFFLWFIRLINEQSFFSSLRVIRWNFFYQFKFNLKEKYTQICFAMWPLVNFIFYFIFSCSWASYEPWEIACYMTRSRTDLIQY